MPKKTKPPARASLTKKLSNATYYDKNRKKINQKNRQYMKKKYNNMTDVQRSALQRRKKMERERRQQRIVANERKQQRLFQAMDFKTNRKHLQRGQPSPEEPLYTPPIINDATTVVKKNEFRIDRKVLQDLGGYFHTALMTDIPTNAEIMQTTAMAFKCFKVAGKYIPYNSPGSNLVLRLRGGANSCDLRRYSASVGVSAKAGAAKRIQKPVHHPSLQRAQKKKKKSSSNAVSSYGNVPFLMQCMSNPKVRELLKPKGIIYNIAKQAHNQIKKANKPMVKWINKIIPQKYRPFKDLCFTGLSIVGDGRPDGWNRCHKDGGESTVGAIVTFGEDDMDGGDTVFWAKEDSEDKPVRLSIEHQNGRITVGRFDLVNHAGKRWKKPRTVYTFYIKTNILSHFEIYKLKNPKHNTALHRFKARSKQKYTQFMQNKPRGTEI